MPQPPHSFDLGTTLIPDKETGAFNRCDRFLKKRFEPDTQLTPELLGQKPLPNPDVISTIALPWLYLELNFRLATPYVSRDDNPFGSNQNITPIVREWVYRVPMVRPTTWKGALRSVATEAAGPDDDARIRRLFGPAKPEDDRAIMAAGLLRFFPTFFAVDERPRTQIFNPHDRMTRRGTVPFKLEKVTPGTSGTFAVLYAGRPQDERAMQREDVLYLCRLIPTLLTQHGFGGKTLKGDGLCQPQICNVQLSGRLAGNQALSLGNCNAWCLAQQVALAMPPEGRHGR